MARSQSAFSRKDARTRSSGAQNQMQEIESISTDPRRAPESRRSIDNSRKTKNQAKLWLQKCCPNGISECAFSRKAREPEVLVLKIGCGRSNQYRQTRGAPEGPGSLQKQRKTEESCQNLAPGIGVGGSGGSPINCETLS